MGFPHGTVLPNSLVSDDPLGVGPLSRRGGPKKPVSWPNSSWADYLVISIVKPETLLAWNRRQKQKKWTFENRSRTPGRRRKAEESVTLVVRLAGKKTSWGYRRVYGELKKLGHQACPSYVRDVLRRHGLPPVRNRKGLSWKQFLQSHLEVTWATDFFTEEVWTLGGLLNHYSLKKAA